MRCSCHQAATGSFQRRRHKADSATLGFPFGHFGTAFEQPATGRTVHSSGLFRLRSCSAGLRGDVASLGTGVVPTDGPQGGRM